MCADLGLGSEFMLPIAHQIREQILEYQRVRILTFNFNRQLIKKKGCNTTNTEVVTTLMEAREAMVMSKT